MANSDDDDTVGCLFWLCIGGVVWAFNEFSDGETGTGFLLLLTSGVLGWIAWKIITDKESTKNATGRSRGSAARPNVGSEQLRFSVAVESRTIEGVPVAFLEFKSLGVLCSTESILRPCFEVWMLDVTDGAQSEGDRVLTLIDDHQEDTSTELRYSTVLPQPIQAGAGSIKWVTFGAIPVETLLFPMSGQRRFKVVMAIKDLTTGRQVSGAVTFWDHHVERGYLEYENEETEAQAASLQLAMVMAAADGTVDDDEVVIIKRWGEKNVNGLSGIRKQQRQQVLNAALREATGFIRNKLTARLEDIALQRLLDLDERQFMYEAYELCLHVLKADGEAHPQEMARLTAMAKRLDLDEAKVRVLTDRHISEVQFSQVEGESADDQILGITPEMSPDDIRKHLNKLYQKHQARSTNDNPDVAAKAKDWLARISAARVRHLG